MNYQRKITRDLFTYYVVDAHSVFGSIWIGLESESQCNLVLVQTMLIVTNNDGYMTTWDEELTA